MSNGNSEGPGSSSSSQAGMVAGSSDAVSLESKIVGLRRDLYDAEDLTEAVRAVFKVVPVWVPAAGLVCALGLYYVSFRVRLFLAKWRAIERRKAERKYELLDNLRGIPMMHVRAAVEALGDDDGDEEEEEDDDETAVSMRDIDEFRSSLGIRLPRDEDLLGVVERMLMVDSIPDGWVLYRTTAGIIRFMNLNTQELFFFPPNKRREKALIESELRKRNRQAMESKFSFSYEDENMNTQSLGAQGGDGTQGTSATAAPTSALSGASAGRSDVGPSAADFDGEGPGAEEDDTQSSTFKRMFHYFLEKEQKKIEESVVRKRATRDGSVGGVGGSAATGGLPHSAVSGGSGLGDSAVASHRMSGASMTYRVVPSSTIRGNRGGGGNGG